METKSCVNKKGIDTQNCSAWTQSDGQDLSDYMDYHTTQIGVMHLAYGYYFTLASYKPDDAKHLIIKNWFTQFMERNRRPTNVGFGLDLIIIGQKFSQISLLPMITIQYQKQRKFCRHC